MTTKLAVTKDKHGFDQVVLRDATLEDCRLIQSVVSCRELGSREFKLSKTAEVMLSAYVEPSDEDQRNADGLVILLFYGATDEAVKNWVEFVNQEFVTQGVLIKDR